MVSRAQVVIFCSQKGGSGKTTLSGHMAVEAERAGAGPVALIDMDPQGSLAKWWQARTADLPALAQSAVPRLADDLAALDRAGFKLIVIDTPPTITRDISTLVAMADLAVIPTRPSPHDLRAVGPTVDIVDQCAKPLIFIINAATPRARLTSEIAVALSQHGTVAPVTLHHRVDFAASMIDGRTVGEAAPQSRSAREVAALWAYLDERLSRLRALEQGHSLPARSKAPPDTLTPLAKPAPAQIEPGDGLEENENEEEDMRQDEADAPPFPDMAVPRAADLAAAPAAEDEMAERARPAWPHIELPTPAPQSHPDAKPGGGWDGIDRRKADQGPPSGFGERRKARQVPFGRRGLHTAS